MLAHLNDLMMRKKIIWVIIPVIILVAWLSFTGGGQEAYVEQVQEKIEERKHYLKTNSGSPFLQYGEPYREPEYYPIDATYRVNATVERISPRKIVSVANSNAGIERYEEFAWLNFSIQGERQKLLVLRPTGFGAMNVLFLAFTDATSAGETYGGGRYLEVEIGKSDKLVLDFNLAYNPYCAYTDQFTCPLPPRENLLSVAIRAGEMNFPK